MIKAKWLLTALLSTALVYGCDDGDDNSGAGGAGEGGSGEGGSGEGGSGEGGSGEGGMGEGGMGEGGMGGGIDATCESECARVGACAAASDDCGITADTEQAFVDGCIDACNADPALLAVSTSQAECDGLISTLLAVSADFQGACEPAPMTPPFGQAEDVEMANAVWAEIADHQKSWPQPAAKAGWVEGAMPHGGWQQIYQNGTDPAADGYIVIKRNYGMQSEDALGALTVMKKIDGYDEETGNWFFAKYLPDGSLDMNPDGVPLAGRVGKGGEMGCVPCHSGAAGGDFLHSFDGPEIPSVPMGRPYDVDIASSIWAEVEMREDFAAPAGLEGWQMGNMPHGAAQQYGQNGEDINADGYIIVKANYAEENEETLGALTVMKKIEGFDAEINDWFFVKYLPDGSLDTNPAGVPLAGRVGKGGEMGCVPCHSGAPGGDYLFFRD